MFCDNLFDGDDPCIGFSQPNKVASGQALDFNGSNDYITLNSSPFVSEDKFTVSFWFKAVSGADEFSDVISANDNGTTGTWHLRIQVLNSSDGRITFSVKENGNMDQIRTVGSYDDGEWHQAALVRQGSGASNLHIYVDGVECEVTTFRSENAGTLDNLNSWSFGRIAKSNLRYYEGGLDEIRIWNRVLSKNEVQSNMTQKLMGNESGLIGYWRFDTGSGTTAFDSSPQTNNGTLTQ